jgi:hypothetical protein
MMFRIVFWDVLRCKIIVDRRFRGAYCLPSLGMIPDDGDYFTRRYIPEDNSEHHRYFKFAITGTPDSIQVYIKVTGCNESPQMYVM